MREEEIEGKGQPFIQFPVRKISMSWTPNSVNVTPSLLGTPARFEKSPFFSLLFSEEEKEKRGHPTTGVKEEESSKSDGGGRSKWLQAHNGGREAVERSVLIIKFDLS